MTRILLIAIASSSLFGASVAAADDAPSYETQIAPFLKTYCVGCHDGGDDSKGGLSVVTYKALREGGDSGEVIVPGKSDESRLVKMILGTAKPKMPPKDSKQPKPEEIELVKRWVDLGAKGPLVNAPQSAAELTVRHIDPKISVAPGISAVVFSPDGHWLAAARHREVLLIDVASNRIEQTLSGAENPINALAFSPDSRRIAAAEGLPSVVGHVRLWEIGGKEPRVFTGHGDSIYALAFSPDGSRFVSASYDKLLMLWDVASGKELHTLKHHTGAVFAAAFSPDGKVIVSAAADQTVKLWNAETGQRILTLTEPTKGLNAVAFHPRGHEIAAAGVDKMIRIYDWNGTTAKLKRSAFAHDAAILSLVYGPEGATLFTGSEDRRIKAWDATTLQERHVYESLPDWPQALAVNRDGTQLAAGLANGDLVLFDARSPKKLQEVLKGGRTVASNGELQIENCKLKIANSQIRNPQSAIRNPVRAAGWPGRVRSTGRVAQRQEAAPSGLDCKTVAPSALRLPWLSAILSPLDGWVSTWRSFLSLRDPAALTGRPGHSDSTASIHSSFSIRNPKSEIRNLVLATPPGPPLPRGGETLSLSPALLVSWSSFRAGAALPILAAIIGQQDAARKPNPPMPRLDAVSPRTVVRGSKIRFTLSGQNLRDADRLFVSHGNLAATLLPADEKNANQAFCEIEIPANMQPGMVALRLHTPLGSTAAKSFYVGPFAEVGEKEDNNKREAATPAALPATLVGTVNSKGDQDLWSCEAQAGQELAFVLLGPSLGSSLNAQLALLDESGRVLASATRQPWKSEVELSHRFEKSGKCFLRVEDRDYTGGGNHFYYVHAGAFAYVTDVFPLGMQTADRGAPAGDQVQEIHVQGPNIPPASALNAAGPGTQFIPIDTPAGKTLNSARFESSPYSEYAELEPNDTPAQARLVAVPCGISGRVSVPATGGSSLPNAGRSDVDYVAFDARKGDRLTIETYARRLGSPLDSIIDVFDAQGNPVPRYTLRAVAETYTVLRDHDSRSKGIRLQHWEDFQPNDFVMLGDEVLKVQILPLGPDEDVKFFDKGIRLGYLGTTPEAHAINSLAYKVEVHPPGASFPPNGMPVVALNYANDDGGPGLGSDSQILFDVPTDGRYLVRVRDVRNLAGDDFYYRLAIRPRREDFRISLDPENPNIPRGGSLPVTVNLDRLEGFNGHVDVRLDGLPEGITATPARIGPDLFNAVLTLTAAEDAHPGEPGVSAPGSAPGAASDGMASFKVVGSAAIGEKTVEHATTPGFGLHQVTVTSPPDLRVAVEPLEATITPGQELKFTVTIERRNTFAGRVPVEVLNLPHGLRVLDVGLNGVLINETETSRSFVVACDPWCEPGTVLFYAAPKVESKNERHATLPIRLEVRNPAAVAGK